MTRIDIMLDIETLGKQDNTAIFQIYAKAVSRETYETVDEIELKIDINSIDPSLIEMDTLYWWTQNHPELFKELTAVTDDHMSEYDAATRLWQWLKNDISMFNQDHPNKNEVYLWGNGSVFDNVKIKNFLQRNGYSYPIYYRNDRDLRTHLESASMVSGYSEEEIKKQCEIRDAVAHNAKDDVDYQIEILKFCDRLLGIWS